MKQLLSIEQLSKVEIERILRRTAELKTNRGKISAQPLAGQTWALIFSKPSTRTRVSFEVGIRELGGETIYLNAADAQLGRGELIKDTARVLARMIHGAVIRTYAQSDIEESSRLSRNAAKSKKRWSRLSATAFLTQRGHGYSPPAKWISNCGSRRTKNISRRRSCSNAQAVA